MPTPSEILVETKGSSEVIQNDKSSIDTHLEAHQDMQQKKKQLNQSPRRKNSTNRSFTMQSNRHHRHSNGFQKKNNEQNYKQSNQPIQQQQPERKTPQNLNSLSNNQHQDSNKKSSQKSGYRMYKNHNGNMHYDVLADNTTAPPPSNFDNNNDYLNRQQQHSPGDSNDVPRKYSKNFLNEVGYHLTTSKHMDEQTTLRMALGDNSRIFGHYFSGQFIHGNPMILQVCLTE